MSTSEGRLYLIDRSSGRCEGVQRFGLVKWCVSVYFRQRNGTGRKRLGSAQLEKPMGTRRAATAGAVAEHAEFVGGVVAGEPREKEVSPGGGFRTCFGIRSAQVETLTFKILSSLLSWGAGGFDRKWNASPGIRCQASVPLLGSEFWLPSLPSQFTPPEIFRDVLTTSYIVRLQFNNHNLLFS